MGVAASQGVLSTVSGSVCCSNRRTPCRCWNPQLSHRLVTLDYGGEVFEEVWVFRDDFPLDLGLALLPATPSTASGAASSTGAAGAVVGGGLAGRPVPAAAAGQQVPEAHYAIVFNYGPGPLRPLRLDWRSDGLSFFEGGLQPREEVQLKVFREPLKASALLGQLEALRFKVFDPVCFDSKAFCKYLYEFTDGTEEAFEQRRPCS